MQFREKARATLVLCLATAMALPAVVGCHSAPDSAPPAPLPGQLPRPPAPVDPAEVLALLDEAEAAMAREQLTFPAQGSALVLYDTVLVMDPDNAEARRGLERIVEHYLELAETAARRNQLTRARSMVERARLVDADHPAVAPIEIKIELLSSAKRDRLALDKAQLTERSTELGAPLRQFGSRARRPECRATIRVRSDAEGRWVYQQMNQAPGDARIRAEIQIGSPPRVELVCFQDG